MCVVVVAGALANKPHNGGGAWERMSWVTGLRRLGCDVYFIEQITPAACISAHGTRAPFLDSTNVTWFRSVAEWFGLADRATLVYGNCEQCAGLSWPELCDVAERADLLINLSGHLSVGPLFDHFRCKAYVDVDPGFTQFWHVDPATSFTVDGHDFYFTVGENIGASDCPIPTGNLAWRPIRQPVVLADWPAAPRPSAKRFTTVASWRGAFGPVAAGGRTYGLKVHEFRKVLPLPQRVPAAEFEVALDIHPADATDLAALHEHGWHVTNPRSVAGDPASFRRYVEESAAEFSPAQGVYVETHSGWFSDRSVRYLASGRPVVVQDTGFSRHLPVGDGLLAYRTLDDAAAAVDDILTNYDRHARAARELASEYFDADKILSRLLDEVGLSVPSMTVTRI